MRKQKEVIEYLKQARERKRKRIDDLSRAVLFSDSYKQTLKELIRENIIIDTLEWFLHTEPKEENSARSPPTSKERGFPSEVS